MSTAALKSQMTTADAGIRLKGVSYQPDDLPVIYIGRRKRLAYVLNAKAACTMALNFLFVSNHGYAYVNPPQIHGSRFAFIRLGPEYGADQVKAYNELAPETFAIVRDPLQRFVSAFISKVFTQHDANYADFRDLLTSIHGVDLSADADPAKSCLAFAKLVAAEKDIKHLDRHFRPQHLNLARDGRFPIDTLLRLEDRDAVLAFFSKWMSAEKARELISQGLGATPDYPKEKFITDELIALVRKIFSRDYELFYR
jgi:Sulfotransferase family